MRTFVWTLQVKSYKIPTLQNLAVVLPSKIQFIHVNKKKQENNSPMFYPELRTPHFWLVKLTIGTRSLRRSGGILLRLPGTADGSGTTSAVAKPRASEAPMLVTVVTDIHIISPPFCPVRWAPPVFFYTQCHPHTHIYIVMCYIYHKL